MRQIKFRAWDNESNEMIDHVVDLTMWRNGKLMVTEPDKERKDVVLMQYTGLLDKNGKEIYEGDIIELVNDFKETIRVVCEYGIARRYIMSGGIGIEVDIPSFYLKLSNGKKSFPIVKNYAGKHDLQIFEIIGNIYETPELLTP